MSGMGDVKRAFTEGQDSARRGGQPSENPAGIDDPVILAWFSGFFGQTSPKLDAAVKQKLNSFVQSCYSALLLVGQADNPAEVNAITAILLRQLQALNTLLAKL